MAKFNPNMLVPAEKQGSTSNARSAKDVLIANIDKQKHLFNNPEDDGKPTFKIDGDNVLFTLRVSNTALVLGQYEQDGVKADVREMQVPKAHFVEALDFLKDKVVAGEMDTQLTALDEKKHARVAKLRATRAAGKDKAKV